MTSFVDPAFHGNNPNLFVTLPPGNNLTISQLIGYPDISPPVASLRLEFPNGNVLKKLPNAHTARKRDTVQIILLGREGERLFNDHKSQHRVKVEVTRWKNNNPSNPFVAGGYNIPVKNKEMVLNNLIINLAELLDGANDLKIDKDPPKYKMKVTMLDESNQEYPNNPNSSFMSTYHLISCC